MQPIYSPDGRFWWDGRQWQPVPGAPLDGPPPPSGPPQWMQAPSQPGGAWSPGAQPPRRRNRLPLIIGIAALVLVLITVAVVIYLYPWQAAGRATTPSSSASTSAEPSPAAPTLQPGEPVTKEKLSQVSAADFLWGTLTRQMTAPTVVITDAYFQTPANFTNHDQYYIKQIGIDHRTGTEADGKDTTLASVSMREGKPEHLTRCVDGQAYWLTEDLTTKKPKWRESSTTSCTPDDASWRHSVSDGIVPNGLTAEQAAAMIESLREEFPGFVNARRPSLITSGGKTYVRQIVDYKPIKLGDGRYWGTQIFLLAFKRTGLDPLTWPFMGGLGPGEGLHVSYYLDPATLLPVAATVRSTPVLGDDGKVRERYDQTQVFNYRYPDKLTPLTLKDTKPPQLTLPEGWKIPK